MNMIIKELRPIILQIIIYSLLWYEGGVHVRWLLRLITTPLITT